MAKMTEAEVQQKLAEGWRWGSEADGLNPGVLYLGSLDSLMLSADPNFDEEYEMANFSPDAETAKG